MINSAGARAARKPVPEIIGRTNAELFPGEVARALSDNDLRVLETGETVTYEEMVEGERGARTHLVTKGVYRDRRGFALGLLRIARDITDRKVAEAQLAHDSLHDVLTGLPNRARFLEELSVALSRVRRKPGHLY